MSSNNNQLPCGGTPCSKCSKCCSHIGDYHDRLRAAADQAGGTVLVSSLGLIGSIAASMIFPPAASLVGMGGAVYGAVNVPPGSEGVCQCAR